MKEENRVSEYVDKISEFVSGKQYKKIVLQLPKQLLPISFDLTVSLKRQLPHRQFYTLYDSLKQPCCTDTLGAQHVNYDCLVHFGRACFSSPHQSNHYYVFDEPNPETKLKIRSFLVPSLLNNSISLNNIGYLLVDQPYYQFVKREIDIKNLGIQLLTLPFDSVNQHYQYLLFGYYGINVGKETKNILIVADETEGEQQMNFIQKVSFTLKSFQSQLGQKLFKLSDSQGEVVEIKLNHTKRLMQRYSMASQLQNYNVFGILVSNTAASFVNKTLYRCQDILKKHKKKHFLFMMNNLNEVKLGNFPEIEVYVIVSCFNHSLFSVKDFHRLVVTPTDLEIAFENRSFDEYGFDLISEGKLNRKIDLPEETTQETSATSTELAKLGNQEVALQNTIQTLAFYQNREFKGLVFSDKKEIKKLTKGKIGLAQQYSKLE